MAGAPATRSRRRQAAQADRARPDTHATGRANKHHHQDASQSKPKSADSAEQKYMERLTKEFSSLPEREMPQSDSSGGNQVSTGPRPNTDSMSQTNAAITKTIRSAFADINRRS